MHSSPPHLTVVPAVVPTSAVMYVGAASEGLLGISAGNVRGKFLTLRRFYAPRSRTFGSEKYLVFFIPSGIL